MGRWAPKYTAEQRQAVASAMLDRQMSATQAVAALKRGDLGVPPITMPATSAYDYKRQEHRRRQGLDLTQTAKGTPDEAVETLRRRLIAITDRRLDQLAKTKKPTWDEIRAAVRVQREIEALGTGKTVEHHRREGPPKNGDTKAPEEDPTSTIARELVQAHRRDARGHREDRTSKASTHKNGNTETTTTADHGSQDGDQQPAEDSDPARFARTVSLGLG